MQTSPFQAYYKARLLEEFTEQNKLIPAYASSNVEVYPYQIAAAEFVMRSVYLPGAICADECSLGKTYVALLVATQKWFEGKERLLLVLPVNMIGQWVSKIENSFSIPYMLIDNQDKFNAVLNEETTNPFQQDCLIITTYEFAVQKSEHIKAVYWDLIIFDEADRLNKCYSEESKTAQALKKATDGSFKMLLTGTPITMDIRDIYGLLYFIDENILPTDINTFYKHYFRRPDRYPELSEWVSAYCFRTLKNQVENYANFTNRISYTIGCDFTQEEELFYDKLQAYFELPEKIAYPEMAKDDLALQHNHIMSSSAQAYLKTVSGAIKTLKKKPYEEGKMHLFQEELELLEDIKKSAETIKINGKTKMLLELIKQCFGHLQKLKLPLKAVVYVDNLTTMDYLYKFLNDSTTKKDKSGVVLTFSGSNSRDYSVIEKFRNDKDIHVLVATGDTTKGLDLEFCPLVINYDLLSNALELEQRISRCHRQGQSSDVLVINLFSKYNDADLRYLELINKRTLQFDGIFGLSDMVLDYFYDDIELDGILAKLRPPTAIQKAFTQNLAENALGNKAIVSDSINTLFTTFTSEVAGKITVTPQYIEEEAGRLNGELWEVVKWFFEEYNRAHEDCYFSIDKERQTITAENYEKLPLLFYYFTGSRNKPYTSLKAYGMSKNFKPHGSKITLASPIGRGVIASLECADEGTLAVDGGIEPCAIALYSVEITVKGRHDRYSTSVEKRYVLIGKTASGAMLGNAECKDILGLPVKEYSHGEHTSASWLKGTSVRYRELDGYVPKDQILNECKQRATPAIAEEIEKLKRLAIRDKLLLEHTKSDIQVQIDSLKRKLEGISDNITEVKLLRQISLLEKEARSQADNLRKNHAKIDTELQAQIEELKAGHQWFAAVVRHFALEIQPYNSINMGWSFATRTARPSDREG